MIRRPRAFDSTVLKWTAEKGICHCQVLGLCRYAEKCAVLPEMQSQRGGTVEAFRIRHT